jgi:hypothetical protein
MGERPTDEFSAAERQALEAWVAPQAPLDFADRVLARHRTRSAPLVAAALFIAGVAALAFLATRAPIEGASAVETRSTLALGGRAIAVAEAGAALSWTILASGDATVTQERGNVFYRVEPGGAFTVQTPAGTARVTGTCFRVEVTQMNGSSLKGAAVGAAISALVVVTVYEGQVVAGTGPQQLPISAGEAAVLERNTARLLEAPAQRRVDGAAQRPESRTASVDVTSEQRVIELQQEAAGLRERVRQLEASLKDPKSKANAEKTYDLPEEELVSMAEKCELRWDHVEVDSSHPPTVSGDDAKQVGFTPEQQKAIDSVLAAYNQQMIAQTRALYAEITHDPNVGSMAFRSMVDEAIDKTSHAERQKAFQNLARERAGLQPPPDDLKGTPAFERLFRLFQGSGDALEVQIGKVVGPDLAHAYRNLHGGFGSRHRSSSGCPNGSP